MQKIEGIFGILQKVIQPSFISPFSLFALQQLLVELRPFIQEGRFKPLIQQMFYSITPLLSSVNTESGIFLLRLCLVLLPEGLEPSNVLLFVQQVNSLTTYYQEQFHTEFCILSAGIISKTAQIALPRSDFESIQIAYRGLWETVLECDECTLSCCLQYLVGFMMSYPGDFHQLVTNPRLMEKLKKMLMSLQKEKQVEYVWESLEDIQKKVNLELQKKKESVTLLLKEIENMKDCSVNESEMNQVIDSLRVGFRSLKTVSSDHEVLKAMVSKEEVMEWKHMLDDFFPFFLLCYIIIVCNQFSPKFSFL